MKIFIIIAYLFLHHFTISLRKEECGPGLVQCVDNNKYIICFAGKLVGPKRTCKEGSICINNGTKICAIDPNFSKIPEPQLFVPMAFKAAEPEEIHYCLPISMFNHKFIKCNELASMKNQSIPGTGCKKFFFCGKDKEEIYECPEKQYFDGRSCSKTYVCPQPCTELPLVDTGDNIDKSNKAMYTSGLGRWPVKGTYCKAFTEWSYDKYGKIMGLTQKCPHMSWFDPHELRCRMRYLCEDNPNPYSYCKDGVDHGYCDPEFSIPTCTDYIPLPVQHSGCHYFAACDIHGTFLLKCPKGSYFDPDKRMCTHDYKCPFPCTLYPEEGFKIVEIRVPECPFKDGSYTILNSECTKYITCVKGNKTVVDCPLNTWFDPALEICTPNYKCPEICVPFENEYIMRASGLQVVNPAAATTNSINVYTQIVADTYLAKFNSHLKVIEKPLPSSSLQTYKLFTTDSYDLQEDDYDINSITCAADEYLVSYYVDNK